MKTEEISILAIEGWLQDVCVQSKFWSAQEIKTSYMDELVYQLFQRLEL